MLGILIYLFIFINCEIRLITEFKDKNYEFTGLSIQKTYNETHLIVYTDLYGHFTLMYSNEDIFINSTDHIKDDCKSNLIYLYSDKTYVCSGNLKNMYLWDYLESTKLPFIYNYYFNYDYRQSNFIVLKDKSIVTFDNPNFILDFNVFKYPLDIEPDYNYKNDIISTKLATKHYMVELSNSFFYLTFLENNITGYLLDEKFKTLEIYYQLIEENTNKISLLKLSGNNDDILFCYNSIRANEDDGTKCLIIYIKQNKILKGDSLVIQKINSNYFVDFALTSIGYNKFAIVIVEDKRIWTSNIYDRKYEERLYLTYFNYEGNSLKLGKYKEFDIGLILEKETVSNMILNYFENKGLVLYYLDKKEFPVHTVIKAYLEESCVSESFYNITPNSKNLIEFNKIISSGPEPKYEEIIITKIEEDYYTLYKDDIMISIGNKFNINDKIYIKPIDTNKILKLYYSYAEKECILQFSTKESFIYINNEKHRCFIDPNRKEINNITSYEIKERISSDEKIFNLSVTFEKKVEKNDLIFYFMGGRINCKEDENDDHKILCQGPVPKISLYDFSQEFYISSKLSCVNKIDVAMFKLRDKYLLDIYVMENMDELTSKLNPDYDPSEVISTFSINMISYYYWFAGIAYCDDNKISNSFVFNQCCDDEKIIYSNEWTVLEQKEYKLDEEYGLFHVYNFVILKHEKYKKYVFGFPGTTSLGQLFAELLGCSFVVFDENEPEIKIERFFWKLFKLIYKDVFSSKIINEINSHPDYQIIFIGHSLGGAIATLASYYYAKNKLSNNEPVLITFGQPRVGNENFARRYMELIKLVFRVARSNDFVTMVPPAKRLIFRKAYNSIYLFLSHYDKKEEALEYNFENKNFFGVAKELIANTFEISLDAVLLLLKMDLVPIAGHILGGFNVQGYCHIGGLYVLKDNKFYHCADFYNEETNHPICKNYEIDSIEDVDLKNHGYLKYGESFVNKCQKDKKFKLNPLYLLPKID